jgi:hypothetical protein
MKRTPKNAIEAARSKMDYCRDNEWEPEHIAHVQGAMQRAVEAYENAMPRPGQADATCREDPVERKLYQSIKRRRAEKESETRRYLAALAADTDVNVLDW